MTFVKGMPKIGGRQKGVMNQITTNIRQAYALLLQNNIPKLEDWIERVAEKDPAKALDFHIEISKRFVPTLQAIKVEGEITHTVQPPTITMKLAKNADDATPAD